MSRSSTSPPSAMSSRLVYLQSCSQIAAAFAADGFKYAKSGPHLTKHSSRFLFRIAFQSSQDHMAGAHSVLLMHANVWSHTLRAWRVAQTRAHRQDGHVAGGMAHLLDRKLSRIEWKLADPANRNQSVRDAVRFIRSRMLVYFAQFEDPESSRQKAMHFRGKCFRYCLVGRIRRLLWRQSRRPSHRH